MKFGYRLNRNIDTVFFGESYWDIIKQSGAVKKGGDIIFFFLKTEEPPRDGVFDDKIFNLIFELMWNYEVIS